MIFKDEHGINVVQFGTGDVLVAAGTLKSEEPKEVVSVSFCQKDSGEIGVKYPELSGKFDCDINGHTRFVFTKVESIQVVIEELEKAKEMMEKNIRLP